MYYRARSLALSNGRTYHIAAILRRNGRIVKIGENTSKTHPRFKKYDDKLSMAKPCSWCMAEIKAAGIKKIKYTNWHGNWETMCVEAAL